VRAELVSATSIAVPWAPLSAEHANDKIIGYTVALPDVNPILNAEYLMKSIDAGNNSISFSFYLIIGY
jgi:hypothetical protein